MIIELTNVERQKEMEPLLQIWESAVRATHHFLAETDIDQIRPQVETGILAITHFYVTKNGNEITGFIGIEEDSIEMLFIDNQARGKGYGKILLNYAVNELNAKYVDVNEQNESGRGFYEHMGFSMFDYSEEDDAGNPFPILHLKI